MTPEKFIQDRWSAITALTNLIPEARVITGDHNRLEEIELPAANVSSLADVPDYHTSHKERFRANLRIQIWDTDFAGLVAIKAAIRENFHRKRWSGGGYVVGLCIVDNQQAQQQEDGEWQLITELTAHYGLT